MMWLYMWCYAVVIYVVLCCGYICGVMMWCYDVVIYVVL